MTVFKVCSSLEWRQAKERGQFTGSAIDLRDGFIHLSTGAQLAETLRLHFKGQHDLVLIEFSTEDLIGLVWEPSRNHQLFPHLYGALPLEGLHNEWLLELDPQGIPLLPWSEKV